MTKTLCITGMHRSGTSLTASWLQKCGLPIDNGLLYDAGPGNPKGHFEDKEFADFHSSVIKHKSKKSEGWKFYAMDSLYFSDHQLVTAKQLISERNYKFDVWGWKDPRSIFFLEQWKKIIPNLKAFLIWRPAQEVVFSLLKRSQRSRKTQFSHFHINCINAFRLWNSHNQKVYKYKKMYPHDTILLPLQAILSKDRQVIDLIVDNLQINIDYVSISQLYHSNLMNDGKNQYLNLIAKFPLIANLENNLKKVSDLQ